MESGSLIVLGVTTTQTPSSERPQSAPPPSPPTPEPRLTAPRGDDNHRRCSLHAPILIFTPAVKCGDPFLERQAFVPGRHGNAGLLPTRAGVDSELRLLLSRVAADVCCSFGVSNAVCIGVNVA